MLTFSMRQELERKAHAALAGVKAREQAEEAIQVAEELRRFGRSDRVVVDAQALVELLDIASLIRQEADE